MTDRNTQNASPQPKIRLDYSNVMADFVGEARGLTREQISALIPKAQTIASDIESGRQKGDLGFYQLPYDEDAAAKVSKLAERCREQCENLVVLGIGGSALGGSALFHGLCHPLHNLLPQSERRGSPRVFILENVDPVTVNAVLAHIDPAKTIFNVITKSGATAETMSQFLIVRQILTEKLGKAAGSRIVVTTGQESPLWKLAEESGYALLNVPANVGGRFSALSPVGLFPAAMFGVNISDLLAGARDMDARCRTNEVWQNPAYLNAVLHYLADTEKGLHIAVMMPYADALLQTAQWFSQLWAESLGKAINLAGKTVNSGQSPVVALGATDQHSQLQLYSEGPFNKLITFLQVEKFNENVQIPPAQDREWLSYLGGHSLAELINIEVQSTRLALTSAGRSNISIILPEISPFTIGQLLFMLEVQTVFAGGLYGVNPLDQPGVEASKRYIYGMLGRKGFEAQAEQAKAQANKDTPFVV